jgi:uncharacterized protein (DUF952 family)
MSGYKILTEAEFADLQAGRFAGAPIDIADGYIHLSTADQVAETLERHFAGAKNLVIAAVDIDALGTRIRWEMSRGGALFPHLYGPLTMDNITAFGPVTYNKDGSLRLPGA